MRKQVAKFFGTLNKTLCHHRKVDGSKLSFFFLSNQYSNFHHSFSVTLFNKINPLRFSCSDHAFNSSSLSKDETDHPFEQVGDDYSQIEELCKEGMDLYSRKNPHDHTKAVECFTRVIDCLLKRLTLQQQDNVSIVLDPTNPALTSQDWSSLFMAYFYRGLINSSIEDYSRAAEIDPLNARVYHNRGLAYYNEGKNDQAFQDFNTALSLDPTLVQALWYRATLYHDHFCEYLKSASDFETILQVDPDFGKGLLCFQLGMVYKKLGSISHPEESIQHCKKAISYFEQFIEHTMKTEQQEEIRNNNLLSIYYNLPDLYMHVHLPEKALYALSQFIKLCSKNVEEKKKDLAKVYCSRGSILSTCFQKYDLAMKDFQKAIQLDPEYEMSYVHLANEYYCMNDTEQAFKFAKQAEEIIEKKGNEYKDKIRPLTLFHMYRLLGLTYSNNNEHELAVKSFEAGFNYGEYDYQSFVAFAFSCTECKEFEKGIQVFTQQILRAQNEIAQNDKSNNQQEDRLTLLKAYLMRACVYIFAEKYELALQDIDFILSKEPENAEAIITRGEAILRMTGNLELAQPYFDKGLQIVPEAKPEIEKVIEEVIAKWNEKKTDE
nr:unnamed protein product [Naegleria fowleri]